MLIAGGTKLWQLIYGYDASSTQGNVTLSQQLTDLLKCRHSPKYRDNCLQGYNPLPLNGFLSTAGN